MRQGIKKLLPLAGICLFLFTTIASAQGRGMPKDVFKGRLFPPNVILEHQDELNLSKEQFTAIKTAVVQVQADVAEHEWDMREAYQRAVAELDRSPIDEDKVLESIEAVLLAENKVKQLQVTMLIRLRNLLTDEQTEYLRSLR